MAAADISRAEMRDFLRWLDTNGIDGAVDAIRVLRATAEDLQSERSRGLIEKETNENARRLSEKQLASRIEKMMLESKLTKGQTAKAVTELLVDRGYHPDSIPDSSKLAFRAWIERLLRTFSPEELLQIASHIRNYAAHGIDWPLRRDRP